jgi:hypothetical protein
MWPGEFSGSKKNCSSQMIPWAFYVKNMEEMQQSIVFRHLKLKFFD